MNIEQFVAQYGYGPRKNIEEIADQWDWEKKVDGLLDDLTGIGIIAGDIGYEDGLRDQISEQLLDGFEKLQGDKVDTYDEVRNVLIAMDERGKKSLAGLMSKIKGQIAENEFLESAKGAGESARLAESGSQRGWDIAIDNPDGSVEHFQVKCYGDTSGIFREISKVQEGLENGVILDGDTVVRKINWAVPPDSFEKVKEYVAEKGYDIEVYSLKSTAAEAEAIFQEGVDNVIEHSVENLFSELFKQVGTAAVIHAMTNAFLVWKASEDINEWCERTIDSTSITASVSGLSMLVEMALRYGHISTGPLTILISFPARMFLRRIFDRRHIVRWVEDSNQKTHDLIETFQAA